jgi:nucleoside-diphosphate-sugar epimerase
MRVVVTGGAGHLGSAVCQVLADVGFQVHAVDRVYRRELSVPLEVADLLDGQAAYRLLAACDAVVHLANHPNPFGPLPPQQLYADNVAMDINVFQAAVDLGVRKLVFASSVQVFSGNRTTDDVDKPSCLPYLPLDGDLPTCPRNAYALSKEAAEQQLRYFAALEPVTGRPDNLEVAVNEWKDYAVLKPHERTTWTQRIILAHNIKHIEKIENDEIIR